MSGNAAPQLYVSSRNNQTTKLFLLEVRKDKAIVKDHLEDVHKREIPLARFNKFFKPAE